MTQKKTILIAAAALQDAMVDYLGGEGHPVGDINEIKFTDTAGFSQTIDMASLATVRILLSYDDSPDSDE